MLVGASTIALLILLAACGGGGGPPEQVPPTTEGVLALMAYVPNSPQYSEFCFSSPRRFLDDAGFQNVRTFEDATEAAKDESLSSKDREALLLVPAGVQSTFTRRWAMSTLRIRDRLGLNFFEIEEFLSAGPDHFDLVQVPFDKTTLVAGLDDEGYALEEHGGIPFYAIAPDFDVITTRTAEGYNVPTGLAEFMADSMNRVWFSDRLLVFAPATQIVTDVIDAASGRAESISSRPDYRRSIEGLSPFYAGCLLDPGYLDFESFVQRLQPDSRRHVIDEVLSRYPQWSPLERPILLALGYYRQGDGRDTFKIGFWYADKGKAKANASELEKRLKQYQSMSADKPLCGEVYVKSRTWSEGSLALAECRDGLAGQWVGQFLSEELIVLLMDRLPEQ